MGKWGDRAKARIDELHALLPPDTSYEDRTRHLREAYPFGERRGFPYKAWCKEQRIYLGRYAQQPKNHKPTPLETMIDGAVLRSVQLAAAAFVVTQTSTPEEQKRAARIVAEAFPNVIEKDAKK